MFYFNRRKESFSKDDPFGSFYPTQKALKFSSLK